MFRDRIHKREATWWNEDEPGAHPIKECHALLESDAPPERWKCCPWWQRKLSNKWNSREFAARHGLHVPELYWHGRDVDEVPFASLPDHYVVRSTTGHTRQNVLIMSEGVNLAENTRLDIDGVKRRMKGFLDRGFWRTRLLVEEFLRTEDGRFEAPTDYKFHMFRERVAGILTVRRDDDRPLDKQCAYFDADWQPFSFPVLKRYPQGPYFDPPACFEKMKEVARRLSLAYETYVRVDLYATDRGVVFGELTPAACQGRCFTPEADGYFDAIWQETFPDHL